ncbi:hypothetical protein V6N13_122249 [Hibiscus sabdariffa]|uniref:Calmodulin-binding domain-containing protein n=1 Tax=Hibiscus sabdariffa TaxID=183260 RepID=A0ABR2NQG6_9ROSI
MVQRKVANKLGILHQADHIKPSSCPHQDGKNKATDLKKIMKKCRPIKVSEPMTLRKTISQPGNPPPPAHNNKLIKAINGSPNYMKSTSSSEAKKETSQVSSRNTQSGLQLDSKNLRNRRTSSTSGNKSATSLTRTSSLKLVRTLTKTPSFKPARASAKKCSRVALCSDMNVQKATCSSTLKDSKFPAYLMLNHGGTEYEGTSVIKVCPYTYCSLNGHHHTPLPPLKSFLKAKRRSMKTQRSMKMEALSPRRTKPGGDGTEGFDSPMKFFVEIYANSKGDVHDVEATGESTQMNSPEADGSGCGNETAPESLSQDSLNSGSEIDFDENVEHGSETISQADIIETLNEDLKRNDVHGEFRGIAAKEESSPWNGDTQEGVPSVDVDHTMFEVIEMEWDEWPFYEAYSSTESDLGTGDSLDESDSNMIQEAWEAGEDTKCVDTCSQISETLSYDLVSSTIMDEEEEEEEERTEIDSTITPSTEDLNGEPSGKEKMVENGVPGTFKEVSEADSPLQVVELKDEGFEETEQFQLEQEEINEVQKSGDLEAAQTVTICDFEETGEKIEAGKDVVESHFAESQDHLDVAANDRSSRKPRSNAIANEDLDDKHTNSKWRIGRKRREDDYEESREFNPREPNFLPVVPEADAERVDLKHQMMDERKNAEEWMLDHALQQAVTKLAPARKRKVALLVEAFETVLPLPITKCETRFKHSSTGFAHGRIQACN